MSSAQPVPSSVLTFLLPTAAATYTLGVQLGQQLEAGSVLLLDGELGAGKTTFVQGLGAGLGIAEAIDSPTFTLVNEYLDGRLPLYHLDLYRLEPAEVVDLHLESYWDGLERDLGIVAIEWAERLVKHPTDYLRVQLTHVAEGGRRVTLIPTGSFVVPTLRLETGENA